MEKKLAEFRARQRKSELVNKAKGTLSKFSIWGKKMDENKVSARNVTIIHKPFL